MRPRFEITKRQDFVNDVPSDVTFSVREIRYNLDGGEAYSASSSSSCLYGLSVGKMIELRERLNALDLGAANEPEQPQTPTSSQ